MKTIISILSATLLFAGCATVPTDKAACGELSTFHQPPQTQDLYQLVLSRIDGQSIMAQPIHPLAPGEYQLRFVEMISDPRLQVSARQRSYKELTVKVEAGVRYHFAAKFNADKRYSGKDQAYWDPILWRTSPAQCH